MLEPHSLQEILAGIVVLHSEQAVPGTPFPLHCKQGTRMLPSLFLTATESTPQIGHDPCLRVAISGTNSPATSLAQTDWILSPAAPSINCGYHNIWANKAIERIPNNA